MYNPLKFSDRATSRTQTQAQALWFDSMLGPSFLPMFSLELAQRPKFMDTTFLGAYVDFFNKPGISKLNFDSLGDHFCSGL